MPVLVRVWGSSGPRSLGWSPLNCPKPGVSSPAGGSTVSVSSRGIGSYGLEFLVISIIFRLHVCVLDEKFYFSEKTPKLFEIFRSSYNIGRFSHMAKFQLRLISNLVNIRLIRILNFL